MADVESASTRADMYDAIIWFASTTASTLLPLR
jgi:hypothetical protein